MFETQSGKAIAIEELSWEKASSILRPLNSELANIIDEISPGKEYKLYKARYNFGAKIIDKGRYFLPLVDGDTISFNDAYLPKELTNNLSYDFILESPIGIILNNKSEFYLSIQQRIMPYSVITPGQIFGLSNFLEAYSLDLDTPYNLSHFMWDLTAGARSIFLLPKITENLRHNKLKKAYNLTTNTPQFYQDQWDVFREISKKENSNWHLDVLFFSNKWYESLTDEKWLNLYNYFLCKDRMASSFWRNSIGWQIIFSAIEQEKNLKFSSYTLDTIKHLFAIASGTFPGFKPATDENAAPIKLIQEAYVNGYGLNDYLPNIMELSHFSANENHPVYYSLNYPTLAQLNPQSFKGKSLISLLEEVQYVLGKYQNSISNDFLGDVLSLDKSAAITDFSFYHSDPVSYPGIRDNEFLIKEDNRFASLTTSDFPKHSAFLKGCIKISNVSNNS